MVKLNQVRKREEEEERREMITPALREALTKQGKAASPHLHDPRSDQDWPGKNQADIFTSKYLHQGVQYDPQIPTYCINDYINVVSEKPMQYIKAYFLFL